MAESKIKPTDDHIVVEGIEEHEATTAGIIIPDTASKEKPQKGRVIAVGPGKKNDDGKRIPMDIKAGDTVLFTKYAPNEIKLRVGNEWKEYLILNESDVLAVLE